MKALNSNRFGARSTLEWIQDTSYIYDDFLNLIFIKILQSKITGFLKLGRKQILRSRIFDFSMSILFSMLVVHWSNHMAHGEKWYIPHYLSLKNICENFFMVLSYICTFPSSRAEMHDFCRACLFFRFIFHIILFTKLIEKRQYIPLVKYLHIAPNPAYHSPFPSIIKLVPL